MLCCFLPQSGLYPVKPPLLPLLILYAITTVMFFSRRRLELKEADWLARCCCNDVLLEDWRTLLGC
ncbi:hypothetical protein LINPERPRIM_LOCUS20308 [Linum perenne]